MLQIFWLQRFHATQWAIAMQQNERNEEEAKKQTPDERCKKLKQVAHISCGCAASTKGKRGAVGPESQPSCSRRRSRAQRDDNEKQFTKSTQRLDQKQRRRVATLQDSGTKGCPNGDHSPLPPAARTMLYNAKHIIKYKILKMEF